VKHAVLVAQQLRLQGFERLAILDLDYNHGNGTQAIFHDRAEVYFISIHGDPQTEYPFYQAATWWPRWVPMR
jgi:acetoin utilization deacetylase AcuC-like enzyme